MSIGFFARCGAAALALLAGSAQASFHLMKVVQVFPGTAAAPNAQYVNIQMYFGGQNQLGGHQVNIFNASGTLIQTFTFSGPVGLGSNQDKILIATPEAASFFNLSADLTMAAVIPAAGGKVCFDATPIDCVAWGNYSGSMAGITTPFNVAGGLAAGRAAIRRIDIAPVPPNSNSLLEGGDDTDNCANDFLAGLPGPRNSAGINGTIPASTCSNGVIEGLEQCDDSNLNNGDGCSSTCQLEPVGIFLDGFE